jgi:uncharacterized protein (DUF433 family)
MEYVKERNDGYYIATTRVSLDSVVYAFLRGESPEGITESFPALSLVQVYGAITFYLANQPTVDAYLEQGRTEFERLRQDSRTKHPRLYAKIDAARHESQSRRS